MARTQADVYFTVIELIIMFTLLMGELCALCYVRTVKGFAWVQKMIFICILSAIGLCFFCIFGYLSQDGAWMKANKNFAAWGWTMGYVLMYFDNSLICWLYSIEQWRVSITVPNQLN